MLTGGYDVPSAQERIETIEIKGRDGSLTKKLGYEDVELSIVFNMYDNISSFKKTFRKAKQHLFNAKTIQVDDDNEVYYKEKSVNIEQADNSVVNFGQFTVNFILDPFQYQVDNESIIVTSSRNIHNHGYESQPIIKVWYTCTGKIIVNEKGLHVNGVNGIIVVDSEQMNAFRPGFPPLNAGNRIMGDFPTLKNGANRISFTHNITKLEVTPNYRWG